MHEMILRPQEWSMKDHVSSCRHWQDVTRLTPPKSGSDPPRGQVLQSGAHRKAETLDGTSVSIKRREPV